MAVFRFGLENVWRHRQRCVEVHSQQVARAERKVASLARELALLDEEIKLQADALARAGGQIIKAQDLIAGTTWLDNLRQRRKTLAEEMQAAAAALRETRAGLTEAWQELEILSQLRERRKTAWHLEQSARERRDMDEIGQIRAHGHRGAMFSGPGENIAPNLPKP